MINNVPANNFGAMDIAYAADLRPYRTSDGSYTLRSIQYDEGYHSVVGAVSESVHVFINAGLKQAVQDLRTRKEDRPVRLVEIGLGTGLNLMLTWIQCLEGKCAVDYTAVEPYPLSREQIVPLAYWDDLAWPGLKEPFLDMMDQRDPKIFDAGGGLTFSMRVTPMNGMNWTGAFDLIYFDPFGPNTHPAMWAAHVFRQLHSVLRPGGILVTYCAKGAVRRTMEGAGLRVERLQGPPGKREMLRAIRVEDDNRSH